MLAVQQQLFDLGCDLSAEWTPDNLEDGIPRINTQHVDWLESAIDDANASLEPLTSFVLPGGTPAASYLHVARTVCRRAELESLRVQEEYRINPQISIYLNRLSDLLFVLARVANNGGDADVLWQPGSSLPETESETK